MARQMPLLRLASPGVRLSDLDRQALIRKIEELEALIKKLTNR